VAFVEGRYVHECKADLILVNFDGWNLTSDDFTKNTIFIERHIILL
jgi:hypothetical protein